MPVTEKACATCKKPFEAWRESMRHCSKKCRMRMNNQKRGERERENRPTPKVEHAPCGKCGAVFEKSKIYQRFCSRACGRHARRPEIDVTSCKSCGQDFKPHRYGALTCSTPCAKKYKCVKKNMYRGLAATERECGVCHGAFKDSNPRRVTCSSECATEYLRRENGMAATQVTPRRKANEVRMPCASCVHGVASRHAELGWECGITRALACKPLIGATLYAARLETGT
jgi:hypothetical protein